MIKEKDGIAAVDAAKLLDPEQRKMADRPRVVEPTIKLKKTVSASTHHPLPPTMRKTFHYKP